MKPKNHANEMPARIESVQPCAHALPMHTFVAAHRKRIREATHNEDWPADTILEKGTVSL